MEYWLFGGDIYYPVGGMHDFIQAFPTLAEAKAEAKKRKLEWWHITLGTAIIEASEVK